MHDTNTASQGGPIWRRPVKERALHARAAGSLTGNYSPRVASPAEYLVVNAAMSVGTGGKVHVPQSMRAQGIVLSSCHLHRNCILPD